MPSDTSAFERLIDDIGRFAEGEWVPPAAEVVQSDVLKKTAKGIDADSNTFHAYSDSQAAKRKALSLSTKRKDLRITGGLLGSIKLTGKKLGLEGSNEDGTEYATIAHGQMHHPRWSYHNSFFAVGIDTMSKVMDSVQREFRKRFQ